MTAIPAANIQTAINSQAKFGITNPYVVAGILATVAKETGFVPKSEYSYANTSNDRLRQIFSSLSSLSDTELTNLKKNDVDFYEFIYGSKYGNSVYGDGYKYRGRGLNGETFKSAYQHLTDSLGVDLVRNPDRLNEFPIAADALGDYFQETFTAGEKSGKLKQKIGVDSIDDIKDLATGVKAAVQANAGWNTNFNNAIIQEGYKKALDAAPGFYQFVNSKPVQQKVEQIVQPVRRKKIIKYALIGTGAAAALVGTLYLVYRHRNKISA